MDTIIVTESDDTAESNATGVLDSANLSAEIAVDAAELSTDSAEVSAENASVSTDAASASVDAASVSVDAAEESADSAGESRTALEAISQMLDQLPSRIASAMLETQRPAVNSTRNEPAESADSTKPKVTEDSAPGREHWFYRRHGRKKR